MTELCAMLEKYRSENQKIVQQKDLQIHSLQSSLADHDKAKVRGHKADPFTTIIIILFLLPLHRHHWKRWLTSSSRRWRDCESRSGRGQRR